MTYIWQDPNGQYWKSQNGYVIRLHGLFGPELCNVLNPITKQWELREFHTYDQNFQSENQTVK